jgi:hypothetical protein
MADDNKTPQRPRLTQALGSLVMVGLVVGGYFAWQSYSDRQANEARAAATPAVDVQGRAKDSFLFGPWTKDSVYLKSEMTLKAIGMYAESIRFTAFSGAGVKLADGPVEYPGWEKGADTLKRGETVQAKILIQDENTKRVVLDIE